MAHTRTREVRAKVPVEVIELARRRVGRRVTMSEVVRAGLAQLAGVDPADYPVRPGRPTRDETAA